MLSYEPLDKNDVIIFVSMKKIFFALLFLTAFACESSSNQNNNQEESNTDIFGNTITSNRNGRIHLLDSSKTYIEQVLHEHFQKSLFLSKDEKYTYEIHKSYLNNDTIKDAIITINRLNFAKTRAKESGKPHKAEALGYMGPFNAFFFYNGRTDEISGPTVIPSSPLLPLEVSFENVTSIDFKSILIDYRIRNSSHKRVYFLMNDRPELVFDWMNFDGLGTSNQEAYGFKFYDSKNGVKNIRITESKISAIPENSDLFTYEPQLIPTKRIVKEFFYIDTKGKYFTLKED
tara:strand:- start:1041 stop:1907 length:867 start_codon:yes stop_codon:yes gene_type:complete